MNVAFMQRQAVENGMELRNSMISGIWANSNYDASKEGEEAPRVGILRQIDADFEDMTLTIYGQESDHSPDGEAVGGEYDPDNPFFAAMKVPEVDETNMRHMQILELERARREAKLS